MPELREQLNALAQRFFHTGASDKLRAEPQQFERWTTGIVEHQKPIADFVAQSLRVPAGEWLLLMESMRRAFGLRSPGVDGVHETEFALPDVLRGKCDFHCA